MIFSLPVLAYLP